MAHVKIKDYQFNNELRSLDYWVEFFGKTKQTIRANVPEKCIIKNKGGRPFSKSFNDVSKLKKGELYSLKNAIEESGLSQYMIEKLIKDGGLSTEVISDITFIFR